MRFRWADIPAAAAGSLLLPALVLATGVLAGMATAVVGSMAGYRAIYYIAILGLIAIGGTVAVTRKEPLRFVFLSLIACFPVAYALVPPGRVGLSVFDLVMVLLTIGLIGKRLFGPAAAREPIFPTASLLVAWLIAIPCVVFSQFPWLSLQVFIVNFALYAFFLYSLDEMRREGGLERLVLLWSTVLLFMAAGLFIDHFLHVNLSLRGGNSNQLTYAAGMEIYRAGGFFQDPQKGGAFLSCLITFLFLLSVRGRFRGMQLRFVVWAAIAAGSAALVTTVSRSAILACLLVPGLALFAFNRWNAGAKLALTGCMMLAVIVMALLPIDTWLNYVPAAVTQRFASLRADFEIRRDIWFDTWNMFASHPLTGIGPGSFQRYLIETQPTVFNYYGIGEAEGFAYIPDQPESGYLKILYEGGILWSAAALLVVADALRRAAGVIADSRADADARTESIAAVAALVNFGLTFVTLATTADVRIAALFAFMLAVIWHRSLARGRTRAQR